jgi:predicted GNAT family acetyltransferase
MNSIDAQKMTLRIATHEDINSLIQIRIDFLTDGRHLSQNEEFEIKTQLQAYFSKHIPSRTFIGIFAEINRSIVSTAYLAISEKPANASFITGITGTILNVYTYPEFRKKGIATKVVEKIIEEAKLLGVSHLDLQATDNGKTLYEKMGFKESSTFTAMGLKIRK